MTAGEREPRMWQHVCSARNWMTVWSQNSPECPWCGFTRERAVELKKQREAVSRG